MGLEESDKVMHPAETGCWAHKRLTEKGFSTDTPPQQGFVRTYEYTHPDGSIVEVVTGAQVSHWAAKNEDGSKVLQYFRLVEKGKFSVYWKGLDDWLATRD